MWGGAAIPTPIISGTSDRWGTSSPPFTFRHLPCAPLICAIPTDPPVLSRANPSWTSWRRKPAWDPIEFRLRHIEDPRAKVALEAVATKAKWQSGASPKRTRQSGNVVSGRGIALALRGGTIVATVALVEVNRTSGEVRVQRLVCAHDCGLIVNPEALRGTIQANLIQSMGRALKEEVTFDRSNVTSLDWNTYPVARWADIPEIEIVLLNHPESAPTGAGEPSSRPTAAAINNAIFDATGVRIRRVPFTPARIKAALA
jgi:nicotinate dehydrogenase subunit B